MKNMFVNQELNAGLILYSSTKEQQPDTNIRKDDMTRHEIVFSVQWVTMGLVNLFWLFIYKISKMKVLKVLRP